MTVPIGTSIIRAISAYENSSTSRSQTACRNAVGQRIERCLEIGVERRAREQLLRRLMLSGHVLGLFHHFAVDLNRVPTVMPPHVSERVVKDREQPRLQVRAPFELPGRPERFEKRVLHQVLGVGRPPCQPERRSVQAVDVRQRFARKPTVGILIPRGSGRSRRGASTEGHESFCQRPVRETRGGAPLFQDCTRRVTAPFAPEDTRRGNPAISGLNAWLSIGTCLARNGGFSGGDLTFLLGCRAGEKVRVPLFGDPAIATTVLATVTSATPTTCVAAFAQPSCLASAAALRGEL